jgi:4-amino-4-deoxy-L-arabinose transferase-like glycosyltransferase
MNSIYLNYYFNGELGRELIYLYNLASSNTLPLVGLTTSHEWLSYGPFYYWIMLPFFKIFNGDPYILFFVALATAVMGLLLNFVVIRKIINSKTALISTIMLAISPLLVWQTRLSKLHTFFFILSPILMYLLYKLWNKENKYLFWTGLVFGLMFSFHLSQIPLFAVILYLLYLKKYNFKSYVLLTLGVIIPNIGLIIDNIKILIWIPYRIVKYPIVEIGNTFNSVSEYLGKTLIWEKNLWFIALIIFFAIFIHYCRNNYKSFKKDFVVFYLISFIGITFIANILHGGAPVHYFLPIYTTVPLLLSHYLSKTKIWPLLISIIFFFNYNFYFNFKNPDDFISITKQNDLAKQIVSEAGGKEINLKRIGPHDYYPENYAQNYKYLILYNNGKLNEKSYYTITINEYASFNLK